MNLKRIDFMVPKITVIISFIFYFNGIFSQENNQQNLNNTQSAELLSLLLNACQSIFPQEIKSKIKKELFEPYYLENDDLVWSLKIIPSKKNNQKTYNEQPKKIEELTTEQSRAQAAYWHRFKRHKKIIMKRGILSDTYYYHGVCIAQDAGNVMCIGPNDNGLLIIQKNIPGQCSVKNMLYVIPKRGARSFLNCKFSYTQIELDHTNFLSKYCMHPTKNKWATALLNNNKLEVIYNAYRQFILTIHRDYDCVDKTLKSIHYDSLNAEDDSLIVMTESALYQVGRNIQKLLTIKTIIDQYVDAKWAKNESCFNCVYESSYQHPEYFILRFEKKYVHPEPNETYSLLFKRSQHIVACKLLFKNKVGFLQKPSFIDGCYNLDEGIKTPRRLLVLRHVDEIIKNAINSMK